MGKRFELKRYLQRVGYDGPVEPTLAVLHALTAAHSQSIPFENIDPVLGRPVELEPGHLYRKLVLDRRGGYCFEENGLFLEALTRVGFAVRPLSARVRLGTTDRSEVRMRTHMLIEVALEEGMWLTDVGTGSASLTAALRFEADVVQVTPHDRRRLVRANDRWYQQVRRGGEWVDVYEFTGEEMPFIDRVVANWYVSTHPQSPFRHHVSVAIACPDGGRVALSGGRLTVRRRDGSATHRQVAAGREYLTVLREEFGIDLPSGTRLPVAA
ncbi:MAG TPA: arylamine N-acetyltransferase [Nevskiaceae bacterium]